MKLPDIIIAIDGYSSTGKSTLARLIAEHFGFLYLDSGALYRGVTLYALEGSSGRTEPLTKPPSRLHYRIWGWISRPREHSSETDA